MLVERVFFFILNFARKNLLCKIRILNFMKGCGVKKCKNFNRLKVQKKKLIKLFTYGNINL